MKQHLLVRMRLQRVLLSLAIIFFCTPSHSQNLPHWMTAQEQAMMPTYLIPHDILRGTTPPNFAPRASAEWEEIQGLLVTWTDYVSIVREVVDAAQEECTVYIVCTDSNSVKSDLTSHSIPLTNLVFFEFPYNSIWARDYGQWNIYKNDVDEVSLVDWIYNRPRPKDDTMPQQLADALNLPIYEITEAPYDLMHTGGNFMVDGHGTGFSSKLITTENGAGNGFGVTVKSVADIDTIMKKYLGLDRYVLMNTLPYDVIHHIDMHMKLLDEETLLVGQFPSGVSDGPQIESNIQYITDNYLDCYGRPYKIVRIPMPPSTGGQYAPTADYRTYTNSVFVNKTVIVPAYREEYDTTAIRIYKESLPGYKIVPIDCDNGANSIISALGAIHCITKEVGVSDPILISHAPLPDTYDNVDPYLVEAKIETPSGVSNATLYWTEDTTLGYAPVTMTAEVNDSFYAFIPAQQVGTRIFYYINGESNSGRSVNKPLPAPAGYWSFKILVPSGVQTPSAVFTLFNPYPNPANDNMLIGWQQLGAASCKIILTDVFGKTVLEIAIENFSSGFHSQTINTKQIASGMYELQFYVEGKSVAMKKVCVAH